MAGYLGHKPTLGNYTVDEFTTSSAQASSGNFTLSQTVTDIKTLEVSVGGIDQPQSAYSVSGTTLAFGANIVTLGDIVIARHAGESISYPSLEAGAVTITKIGTDAVDGTKIADNAINSEHYATGSIDTAHIANDQITLEKMAGGTDGQIITYDASGDPVAVGPGTSGQVLTSAGANAPPTFAAAAGGGSWEYVSTSSTGSTRDFRNVFSWGTYPCYMFFINGIAMDNAGGGLGARIYNASDVLVTSGYMWNYAVLYSNSSSWSVANHNSDSFMHFSNYPSNGAPLWCQLLVWDGGGRNVVQADCTWAHTHGSNYHGRSIGGGARLNTPSSGIQIKQWAGVFQGGNIYMYRLKIT